MQMNKLDSDGRVVRLLTDNNNKNNHNTKTTSNRDDDAMAMNVLEDLDVDGAAEQGEATKLTGDEKSSSSSSASSSASTPALTAATRRSLKFNYACMCMFAFLTGTDFAVILPTLWDRLHIDYGASGTFMGFVISAYSFSGVCCGLVMGKLADQVARTKPFYLIAIVFAIVGHLVYFVGIDKYVILAARAISGMCLGASTVALAYVARTTDAKQRIGVISLIMASRQLGLMLGPAFNLFLRKLDFRLADRFDVDRKSAPGLFMAALWSLCSLFIFVFYKDLELSALKTTASSGSDEALPQQNDDDDDDEQHSKRTNRQYYKKQFARVEILVLLLTTFFTYFNQTSLETMVIPFTEIMFGWNELHNSLLFCIGGTVIIVSYILIRLLSVKFDDRLIILMGIVSICTGLVIACVCLPFAKQLQDPSAIRIALYRGSSARGVFNAKQRHLLHNNETSNTTTMATYYRDESDNSTSGGLIVGEKGKIYLNASGDGAGLAYDYQFFPAFVLFVLLDILGLPAIAICSASLFTKLIDNKVQGIGQGIQRGILGIGTIVGPLCAGPFVYKPVYLLACTLCFIASILVSFVLVYKRLKVATTTNDDNKKQQSAS